MAVKVEYKGYTLEFPDSATDDDINSYIEQNHSQFEQMTNEPEKESTPVKNTDPNNETNAIERVGWNALKNTVNVLPAIGDTIQLWAAGGDESKVKPFNRMELDEKYTPQGGVEEFAAEAIPYLIPYSGAAKVGAGVAKVAGTGLAGRAASSVAKNAYQGVVGSAANNSDEALGTEFLTDVAVDGVGGALLGKGISMAGNVVKAGKEARRARMNEHLASEYGVTQHIESLSKELHSLNRGNKNFEKGLIDPETGERVLRNAGDLKEYIKSRPDLYGPEGEFNYIPKQVDDYFKRYTNNQYGLYDELPEELASKVFTKEDTSSIRDKILDDTRKAYSYLEGSEIGGIADANKVIRESGGGLLRPSLDIGKLSPEAHKQLGLSRLETLVSRIGSFSERNLPFDVGTKSRELSNKAIEGGKEAQSRLIDREVGYLNKTKESNQGIAKTLDRQSEAWNMARDGRKFSELSDDELDNILTSSSQARENYGNFTPTPASLSRNIHNLEKAKDANPYSLGGIASAASVWAFGGAPLAAQFGLAGAGRILNGSIARDLARVKGGKVFLGDSTRNNIGKGVDVVAEKGSVPIVGGSVDIDMENDKKIQQLDDWASKNGIPEDIMSEAVSRTGADLGSLKGINRVKAMALEIYDSGRIDNPERVDSEGFNPAFVDNVSKIESAMKEAMYGLSDAEIEELVDEYLDENHLEEDEKLTGLKLQRAQQKAIKWALEKTSS